MFLLRMCIYVLTHELTYMIINWPWNSFASHHILLICWTDRAQSCHLSFETTVVLKYSKYVSKYVRTYRPDSQCCGLRHWPYGQCRFFPFFLVLVAWANFGFWVNYGQCRFCTTIGPEVANAPLPNLSLVAVMSAQLCKRHWPTLHCTESDTVI